MDDLLAQLRRIEADLGVANAFYEHGGLPGATAAWESRVAGWQDRIGSSIRAVSDVISQREAERKTDDAEEWRQEREGLERLKAALQRAQGELAVRERESDRREAELKELGRRLSLQADSQDPRELILNARAAALDLRERELARREARLSASASGCSCGCSSLSCRTPSPA